MITELRQNLGFIALVAVVIFGLHFLGRRFLGRGLGK